MAFTLQDNQALRELMTSVFDDRLESKLEQKLTNFPTKHEFFSRMDEVMGGLKAMRQEHMILSHKVFTHDDQIHELHAGVSVLKKKKS